MPVSSFGLVCVELVIGSSTVDGAVVLTPSGEFDAATAPQLTAAVRDRVSGTGAEVVLDLHLVSFMDCAALATVLSLGHGAARGGPSVRLVGVTGQPRDLLVLTGHGGLMNGTAARPVRADAPQN
jgi:anti-anti-sigma factor